MLALDDIHSKVNIAVNSELRPSLAFILFAATSASCAFARETAGNRKDLNGRESVGQTLKASHHPYQEKKKPVLTKRTRFLSSELVLEVLHEGSLGSDELNVGTVGDNLRERIKGDQHSS